MASKPSLAGQGLGLFTDLVEGVRRGLKKRRGDDSRLEGLRRPDVIQAIVDMIMTPVQKTIEFLDRTVSVDMDLTKTMAQLITDGKYDWVNSDIAKHFTVESGSGTRTDEVHLLRYDKLMTSDQVRADMDRQGLRPATFLELLWLGIRHPLLQLEFPIVALGTVVQVHGYRLVTCLFRCDRERSLGLHWLDGQCYGHSRFAAVRK